jgi:hypothetical protein
MEKVYKVLRDEMPSHPSSEIRIEFFQFQFQFISLVGGLSADWGNATLVLKC